MSKPESAILCFAKRKPNPFYLRDKGKTTWRITKKIDAILFKAANDIQNIAGGMGLNKGVAPDEIAKRLTDHIDGKTNLYKFEG